MGHNEKHNQMPEKTPLKNPRTGEIKSKTRTVETLIASEKLLRNDPSLNNPVEKRIRLTDYLAYLKEA